MNDTLHDGKRRRSVRSVYAGLTMATQKTKKNKTKKKHLNFCLICTLKKKRKKMSEEMSYILIWDSCIDNYRENLQNHIFRNMQKKMADTSPFSKETWSKRAL